MVVLESERMLFSSQEAGDTESYYAMEMDAEVRRYVRWYSAEPGECREPVSPRTGPGNGRLGYGRRC